MKLSTLPLYSTLFAMTNAYSGDVTHYTAGLGSCGYTSTHSDHVVALSPGIMNNPADPRDNPKCGTEISIHNPGTGETHCATIVDTCYTCAHYDVAVSPGLLNTVAANVNGGVVGVLWGGSAVGGKISFRSMPHDVVTDLQEHELKPDFPKRDTDVKPDFPKREVKEDFPKRDTEVKPDFPKRDTGIKPDFPKREINVGPDFPKREARKDFPKREAKEDFPKREAKELRPDFPKREDSVKPDFPKREAKMDFPKRDTEEDLKPDFPKREVDVKPDFPKREAKEDFPKRDTDVKPDFPKRGIKPEFP